MIPRTLQQTIANAKQYPYIKKVGIFGSHARNDATMDSDLDILFDYDNSHDDYLSNIGDFMVDIERVFQGKIDWVTVPGLMRSKDEHFQRNVLRDVLWLYHAQGVD